MAAPLTKATLTRIRKAGQNEAAADMARQVAKLFGIEKEPPFIGIVPATPNNPRLIEGRFFPETRSILARQNDDSEITGATIAHELGHWVSYEIRCGGVPRTNETAARCDYVGQHDQGGKGKYLLRSEDGRVVARAKSLVAAHRASRSAKNLRTAVDRRVHPARFYEILEKIHRELGVSTRAARAVEGRYAYPQHWHAASWA